jgi:hypothetical protein
MLPVKTTYSRSGLWASTFVALLLGGCAGSASPGGTQLEVASESATKAPPGTYVDVEEYVIDQGDAPFDQWRAIYATLAANFDDVCGDTFCEGDYANLEPIRLRCTVHHTSGVMKDCAYVFAGSYEDISDTTGSVRVTAKTFSCHLPVSQIKLGDFMTTLSAAGTTPPLRRPLPGTSKSIYDALVGCL